MGISISELTPVATPALSDEFPIVQGGVTYKESVTQLSALLGTVSVTTIIGTAHQVIASNPTGTITLSTPQDIGTTSDVTFGSLSFSPTTKGIVGTPTNNSAAAGYVGEFVTSVIASASAVSLTTAMVTNVTSISLTAGDWDVWGNVTFVPAATTTVTSITGWISSTSATTPDQSLSCQNIYSAGFTPMNNLAFFVPQLRFSLTGTTTIYLSVAPAFGTDTMKGCGGIYARRVR